MKRSKIGNILIILGLLLLGAALGLFAYNRLQSANARAASQQVIRQIVSQLETIPESTEDAALLPQETLPVLPSKQMKELIIDGQPYIGLLTVPSLSLELPVISDWNYQKLKIAPCRYCGTVAGNDLVLMAHNYASHFGTLDRLNPEDMLYFTDVDGTTTAYKVVALDILDPYAVEEVVAGEFDLTLFTCTYGGATRVCVYCERA